MSAPDVLFPATVAGMAPEVPDTSTGSPRRGPAGQDELYLDEILALTPLKRTRLYTLRDKGSFGPVREAPGPTCPRPVFRLDGVAAVCESLGYEARSGGGRRPNNPKRYTHIPVCHVLWIFNAVSYLLSTNICILTF